MKISKIVQKKKKKTFRKIINQACFDIFTDKKKLIKLM